MKSLSCLISLFCGGILTAADLGSSIPMPENKVCTCKDCTCGPGCNCPFYCDGKCKCAKTLPEFEQICDGVTCRWVPKSKPSDSGVITNQPVLYYYYYRYPDGRMVYLGSGTSPTYNGPPAPEAPSMPVYPSGLSPKSSTTPMLPSCTKSS